LFKKIKVITGKCTPRLDGIKGKDGKILTEGSDIKTRWKDYTEDMYKRDSSITESCKIEDFEPEPSILQDEVRKAVLSLGNGKAAACDGIPIELLKAAGDEGVRIMTILCNKIWDTGQWPNEWKKSVFVPIPKKGDARECSNNRTIALISHASKIMLKVIQSRLESYALKELPDVQAGFRKGKGTRDQIANLRWIMEHQHEFGQDVFFCFIDYTKAFDCVDHAKLWKSLLEFGFPKHIVCVLQRLYDGQKATVRTEHGDTEEFTIGKGVRQGCILSPVLFNMYGERIMREAGLDISMEGIRIGGRCINNLRYADDTTLAATGEERLRQLIRSVQNASGKYGLYLNVGKTKVMTTANIDSFIMDGNRIEVVNSFNFLGSTIERTGGCTKEIRRRIGLGKAAMMNLSKIWKDKGISASTKVMLVRALIFPILKYGCESWTVKKKDKEMLMSCELWCWRRLLRISWTERRTNQSILDELGIEPSLMSEIDRQKLRYFGHIMRSDGLEKAIMLGMGEGKRKKGRPRMRWLDEVQELTGLGLGQLKEEVRQRESWRAFINRVSRSHQRLDVNR